MDYSRIKIELGNRNIPIREFCFRIDVSEQGLHQMIRNESMKVETLERISNVLGVPVSYWFQDTIKMKNVVQDGSMKPSKVSDEKIDSLTKDLNEMLKLMASK